MLRIYYTDYLEQLDSNFVIVEGITIKFWYAKLIISVFQKWTLRETLKIQRLSPLYKCNNFNTEDDESKYNELKDNKSK